MGTKKMGIFAIAVTVLGVAIAMIKSDIANSGIPFVRDCQSKDVGVWEFGEGANGCDANRYGSVARIKFVYPEFIFDRTKADDVELRKDYVTNINALLRDLASHYIRSRRADVQDDEVNAFVLAIHAVAHQETYWSHYRIGTAGGYKLATGDRNVSHGMMQINQKYHASRDQDRSFDIVGNVGFGIEHYYDEWEAALKTKCINRVKNQTRAQTFENVARGAYSAYNGGPGAICRWANPRNTWAKNDRNFFKKMNEKTWTELVRDENQKLKVDLDCVRAGDDMCAVAKERRGDFIASRPLLMEDGETCVTTDGKNLQCGENARAFTCLAGLSEEVAVAAPLKVKSTDRDIAKMSRKTVDNRLELCGRAYPEMASIGDIVTANIAIPIRSEIGGRTVGFTKKGQAFQVLDLEVDANGSLERLYRIRLPNKVEGWISGGTRSTADATATVTHTWLGTLPNAVTQWLPGKGGQVEVAKVDGLKLLSSPEMYLGSRTEVKATLTKGTPVEVEDVQIFKSSNEIWLRVKAGAETGFIYAGRTYPALTIDQWVKVRQ